MDTIQAIIVDEKLKYLDEWNANRRQVAAWYNELIDNDKMIKPKMANYCGEHTYHIYCLRLLDLDREHVMEVLDGNGVQSGIHYPVPIEETSVYSDRGWYNENTRKSLF